jgi:hypothetical protein
MARIWFVRDKTFPARGFKEADREIAWCIEHLQLSKTAYIAAYREAWIVGAARLSYRDDSRYVIVEILFEESPVWVPGYYMIRIAPDRARSLLEQQTHGAKNISPEESRRARSLYKV